MISKIKGKIGLALGGGGAKGLAHIGVLKVLEEEKIPIEMIAGTSMGAVIGAIYATGKNSKQTEELALKIGLKGMIKWVDPGLSKMGLIKGKKITDFLKSIIGEIKFADLKIPFACLATDLKKGEKLVIKTGSVVEGVRASTSVVGVFPPVKWGERFLVDGGLINPVPISTLKEMGAGFIMAVNLDSREKNLRQNSWWERSQSEKIKRLKKLNLLAQIRQGILISRDTLKHFDFKEADLIIEPYLKHIKGIDFYRAKECILRGEVAAKKALSKIKNHL